MGLFDKRYRVESARHPVWDYGRSGWYFITICTADHGRFFGEVVEGAMQCSDVGARVCRLIESISEHFPNVSIDMFQVMPDHIHLIIVIENEVGSAKISDPAEADPRRRMSRISPRRGSLPTIIRSFKAAVTPLCHRTGHPEFGWQERYHDRIIRNERELANIRQYILDNPANWEDS